MLEPSSPSSTPKKRFSNLQIVLATFLGTFVAGFACLLVNLWLSQSQKKFYITLVVTVVCLPLLGWLYMTLPQTRYDRLFPIVSGVFMYVCAYALQGNLTRKTLKPGNLQRPLLHVLGIVGLSWIILILIGSVILYEPRGF